MPATSAVLTLSSAKIGDIGTFEVLECHFRIIRSTDPTGAPTSEARAAIIKLKVVSTGGEIIIASVFDSSDQISGKVEYKLDENTTFKTMKFEKSYVIKYGESFDATTDDAMIIKIHISAGTVELDGTSKSFDWAK
jgi:Hemolysin coregulated protein Hcp (TssD)